MDEDEGGGGGSAAFRNCVKSSLGSKKKCIGLSNAIHRCSDGADGSDDIHVIHLKPPAVAPAGIGPPAAYQANPAPNIMAGPRAHHRGQIPGVPPIPAPAQVGGPPSGYNGNAPVVIGAPAAHHRAAVPGVPAIYHKPPPGVGPPPGVNNPAVRNMGGPPANAKYNAPLGIPKIYPKHHPNVPAYSHAALAKMAGAMGAPPHSTKEYVALKPHILSHQAKKHIAKKQWPNTGNCGGHTDLYCLEHDMAGNKLTPGCGSANRDFQAHKKPVFQSNCGGHTDPYCIQHDFAGNTMPLGCM